MRAGVLSFRGRPRTRPVRLSRRATPAVHLFAAMALILGLFVPMFTTVTPAAASTEGPRLSQTPRDGAAPALPAPFSVGVSGSFGQSVPLTQGDDGIWRGTVPVSVGSYTYRVEVQNDDGTYSLGEDADPDGGDLTVDVDGDETGLAFSFDPRTGDITAAGYTASLSLLVDGYGEIALFPTGDDDFQAFVDGFGGDYTYTVLADATPTDEAGTLTLDAGRVQVTLDGGSGSVSTAVVQPGTLAVTVVTADGVPAPGGCYGVFEASTLLGQACDVDDGSADGLLSIDFPNGAPSGTFDLVETSTPDGQEPAVEETVNIGPGLNTIQVDLPVSGGTDEPSDEGSGDPTNEASDDASGSDQAEPSDDNESPAANPNATTGTIEINVFDGDGDPLPGAGFDVRNATGYFGTFNDDADGDSDGTVTIEGVFPGDNTVYMVEAPSGEDLLPERSVTVEAGRTVEVEFAYDTDEPSEDASPSDEAVPSDEDEASGEASPSEEANDGRSTLTVETIGPDGEPLGGASFVLSIGGQEYGPFPDDDLSGDLQITEVGTGTFTLTMETAPAGFEPLPEQTFDVEGGTDQTITFSYEGVDDADTSPSAEDSPSAEPSPSDDDTQNPDAGTIEIEVVDDQGDPVVGAGFDLQNESGYFGTFLDDADGEADGTVTIENVVPGTTTLYMVVAPEDESLLPEQTITVEVGDTTDIAFAYGADEPSEEPSASVEPSPSAEPSPSVEPSPSESPGADGRLVVTVGDGQGNAVPESCFGLIDPTSGDPIEVLNREGGNAATTVCDDDGDIDGDGRVGIFGIPDGTFTLTQTEVADGFLPAEDEDVTFLLGASQEIAVVNESAAEVTVSITRQDDAGSLVSGACVQLERDGSDPIGPVCDDGDGDQAASEPGLVTVAEVPVGTYRVVETTTPDDVQPAESQSLDVTDGGENTVTLSSERILVFGDLTVAFSVDDQPVAGGCVTVTNEYGEFGPFCDDQFDGLVDGNLTVPQVESGDNTVAVVVVPDGYELAEGQETTAVVDVIEGEATLVRFDLVATTGTIVFEILDDETGELIPDLCIRFDPGPGGDLTAPVCDNTGGGSASGDIDEGSGAFTIQEVPAGTYDIVIENLPAEYSGPDAGRGPSVTVEAGETVEAAQEIAAVPSPSPSESPSPSVSPSASPSATASPSPSESPSVGPSAAPSVSVEPSATGEGSILVRTQDQDGEALAGLCLALGDDEVVLAEICDNDGNDGDGTDGVILFQNVPVGSHLITQSGELPDGLVTASAAGVSQNVTVVDGETIEVLLIITVQDPAEREVSVVVQYRDDAGRQLADACFTLDGVEVCDNTDTDPDGGVGQIRFDGVLPGDYTISQSEAPNGYDLSADVGITIDADTLSVLIVTVTAVAIPDQDGDLVVLKVDGDGVALAGSCFVLERSGRETIRVCDSADGDRDGTISFADVEPGTWTLREVTTPGGYIAGGSQSVQILGGETSEATVQNVPRPGRVLIDTETVDGTAIGGACFRLTGPMTYEVCDNADLAGDDGTSRFDGVAPGDYTVEQTVVPAGYRAGQIEPVRVAPGSAQRFTVVLEILPPPDNAGDLMVLKVDEAGAALPGSCFSLRDGSNTIAGPVCDGQDGSSDGTVTFTDVAAGDYTLRETRTPSAAYLAADDTTATIVAGEAATATVVNTARNGAIRVSVVNPQGQPLVGACFDVDDGNDVSCTDSAGRVTFGDVPPGTYAIDQTSAPTGYVAVARIEGVVVSPGVTTDVRVVNERSAPPANTGTVQIATFYCPAGSAGERTVIFDSSDPGPKQLANTAGCGAGDATLSFVRQGGEGGLGQFTLGADGFFQATVPAATYTLTEVLPDLPGDASASVLIGRNQLTQVVVINYVAPPAPAPAAVDVTSYACPAGFQGTIYEDFANNCTAAGSLTNGVTYRLSGAVTQRLTTGDGGETGRAVFGDIPAASYYVEQQLTKGQQILYNFCGLDPDAPATKNVGVGANVALQAGQTVYCAYFSIPPVVSDTTGAIIVQKYVCPTLNPPASYDYYRNCSIQSDPAGFEIALYSGETRQYTPVTDGSTNVDGLLTFSRLTPGTYSLTETGEGWCYAESDSVNTNGDVVVRPNAASKVFIFNCAPVTGQPNTGVGATAASIAGGMTPQYLAMAALLSLALAAAWVARRRWFGI